MSESVARALRYIFLGLIPALRSVTCAFMSVPSAVPGGGTRCVRMFTLISHTQLALAVRLAAEASAESLQP